MKKRISKKIFSRGSKIHKKNLVKIRRGGIRL